MFERKVGDASGLAHASSEASEAEDSMQDASRSPEESPRRVWPRADGPPPHWEGFGKALASMVLRQIKAGDGESALSSSVTAALGSFRDATPSSPGGQLAEPSLATEERPDLCRQTVVENTRKLEPAPEPELGSEAPGSESDGRPPGSIFLDREGPASSQVAAGPSDTPKPILMEPPEPHIVPNRSFPSERLGSPGGDGEQFPRLGLGHSPGHINGFDTTSSAGSVHIGSGSVSTELTTDIGYGRSLGGEALTSVADNPVVPDSVAFGEQTEGASFGGIMRGEGNPASCAAIPPRDLLKASSSESEGESFAAVSVANDRTPFSIRVGPERIAGDYAPEAMTASDIPTASGAPDSEGGLGDIPLSRGESAADMTRTNHLLQQLLDEMRKGHRGFLPPGAREVRPGR